LCAFGLAVAVYYFHPNVRVFPRPALLALVLLGVTVVIGGDLLWHARPLRPPHRGAMLACLAWGMTAATGCAIIANDGLTSIWAKTQGVEFASRWEAALAAPLNEELLKLAGLILIALMMPRLIRSPMDGFIFGAFVGLGFQITENFIYALVSIVNAGGISPGLTVFQSFFARVVLTGWGSHWAMTAVAGAGVGYFRTPRSVPRRVPIAVGLVLLAMAMHWLFDAPLLGSSVGIGVKTLLNFVVALTVYLALRRGLHARARLVTLPGASDHDIDALLTSRRRRRGLQQLSNGPDRDQAAATAQIRLAALDEQV
jgi:RsiW-degrading membrane proteinase PrsW (M82 family)